MKDLTASLRPCEQLRPHKQHHDENRHKKREAQLPFFLLHNRTFGSCSHSEPVSRTWWLSHTLTTCFTIKASQCSIWILDSEQTCILPDEDTTVQNVELQQECKQPCMLNTVYAQQAGRKKKNTIWVLAVSSVTSMNCQALIHKIMMKWQKYPLNNTVGIWSQNTAAILMWASIFVLVAEDSVEFRLKLGFNFRQES